MAPSANTPPSASPRPYDGLDRLFIAGAWRDGASGETAQDVNPYNQEVLSAHVLANRADVDEAYTAAERAQREWAAAAPAERAAVLRRAVELFDARHDELVGWVQRESGSIRAKAEFEVGAARNITEEAASFPYRMHGEIFPSDTPHKENRVYRQPLGVVGVISPWNFPMNLSNRSVATALACGNAVVLKPASDTPVTGGLLLAKIYEEAGLPEGLLSVLAGRGSEIGDYFVGTPSPSSSRSPDRPTWGAASARRRPAACASNAWRWSWAATARSWCLTTPTWASPWTSPSSGAFCTRGRSA